MATTNGEARPNLEFKKMNPYVLLYTPPETPTKTSNQTDPTTIILCSWMGASLRSRALHAAYHHHHALYPSARIIEIRCGFDFFSTTSTSKRRRYISAALTAVDSDPAGQDRRVFAHVFSNGGLVTYHDLALLYLEKHKKRLDVKAMLLDSAPGEPTLENGWNAMSVGLPKGIVWYPSALILVTYLGVYWAYMRILRLESLLDVARNGFNEWDVMDKTMHRLYIYSKIDKLVGWEAVERHAEQAKSYGLKVDMLREDDIPHVQYMIKDEERYWKKIEELWDGTRV